MALKEFAKVLFDDDDNRYFVYADDCPGNELQEITLGAAIDLQKQLMRYRLDFIKENIICKH